MEDQLFFEEIKRANIITIFRHIHPDWDAIGSQLGIKKWIEDTYPDKEVYALGNYGNFVKYADEYELIDDEIIASSLAIVLDCANADRVDDLRFQNAKKVLKIDHHPDIDHYGDIELVDSSAGATCEILSNLFRRQDIILSKEAASFLYMGLLMDTARFSINTTTASSFEAAAYLCRTGIDLPKISEECISLSLKAYTYVSMLRSKMQIYRSKIAYAVIDASDYEEYGVSFEEAKEFVYVFNHINELEIWTLFTQLPDRSSYKGSLRSRHVIVNDIASEYHGGGHALAAGVSKLSREDIDTLLEKLYQRTNEN